MMVGRYHFERVDSGPLATRLISILRLARPLRMASVDAEASPFPKKGPGNDPAALGWTFAHEVAHFLGLRHIRTVTPSGRILTDQIDDTDPAGDSLMERGMKLSPGQIEILLRSALLQAD